jgi:hypothetical protein
VRSKLAVTCPVAGSIEGIVSTVTGVATIPVILAIFGWFTKGG